ncbi:MBL fold metallo-hydrolase [Blastococcus sp. MG754426]|uniref:MBL fold metallo-hydrolase n=1 Tax=unclassified Blastococcus TaxID=2619396 RepID=UPI001EEFEC15|nr:MULTISPECIES: MBL fold metallo-hydrolase [unclassified Blastococcus]MCF6508802.1 MBL fold metallo-hydrolase [Blastococcus sp. MG754426]MCF6513487.1 MBL fold metallo-hydrolase [Blastococcus sp. MG754427]
MTVVDTIETSSLGDRSYLATDGEVAVVVDPQRDIDRVLALVNAQRLQVTHVLETHIHNDYLTGGLELAARTGAVYVLPADSGAEFDHLSVEDGDVLEAGAMRLRVMHTPGHTHHHVSYALHEADGQAVGVFTGGSMLFGATGRTDLVSPEDTTGLTHAQYHSVQRLVRELPAEAEVFPTHGFGSFCSATPTSGTASTVGEQVGANPALTLAEQEYVDALLAGLDVYPAYYARMSPINRSGPPAVDLSLPQRVDGAELRRRIQAGEWVVDLRHRVAFAAHHLPESLNFELGTNLVTYLGWLYRWDAPLTLIGESEHQIADARRELIRIGIDELAGAAIDDIESLADDGALRSYRVSDFAGLATELERGPVQILDARRDDERAAGFVRSSRHMPLHQLADRLDEVPQGEVWVYCGSGYRASIAASVLDRPGRQVVLVNDDYGSAKKVGLEDEPRGGDRRW